MKSKIFIMTAAAILALFSCNDRSNYQSDNSGQNGNGNHDQDTTQVPPIDSTLAFNPNDLPEEPLFKIYTTEGTITIMLYKDTPLHRDNFVKLASERFYDSLLFHRVIYNFMIQTGDPLTKDPANKPSETPSQKIRPTSPSMAPAAPATPSRPKFCRTIPTRKEPLPQPERATPPIRKENHPAPSSTSSTTRITAPILTDNTPYSARPWTALMS